MNAKLVMLVTEKSAPLLDLESLQMIVESVPKMPSAKMECVSAKSDSKGMALIAQVRVLFAFIEP